MKNYSLNEEDEKNFILYYVKNDEKLIVYYADYRTIDMPYTEQNEKMLLNKMKYQFKQATQFYEKSKKAFAINVLIEISALAFIGIENYLNNIGATEFTRDMSIIFAIGSSTAVAFGLKDAYDNVQDYNKHRLFDENEQLLQDISINDVHFMEYNDVKKLVRNVNKEN